jgi:hypothetical protein
MIVRLAVLDRNKAIKKNLSACYLHSLRGDHLRRNIRILFVAGTLTCAVALLTPLAKADPGLTLHPRGFGEKSYAAWKAK